MRVLFLGLVLLAAGCASVPTFEEECQKRGFVPETPEFDRCLIKLETSVKLQERDLMRQLHQQNEYHDRSRGY